MLDPKQERVIYRELDREHNEVVVEHKGARIAATRKYLRGDSDAEEAAKLEARAEVAERTKDWVRPDNEEPERLTPKERNRMIRDALSEFDSIPHEHVAQMAENLMDTFDAGWFRHMIADHGRHGTKNVIKDLVAKQLRPQGRAH